MFNSFRRHAFAAAAAAMLMLTLCACGTLTDTDNKNETAPPENFDNPKVSFYCDVSSGMQKYLNDVNYPKVVYSAYSAVTNAWPNTNSKVYLVSDSVNDGNKSYFTSGCINPGTYSAAGSGLFGVVKQSKKVSPSQDSLDIFITDLNSQLSDYDSVARFIIDNSLNKDNAAAVVGVDSSDTPYYLIVLGNKNHVSGYISAFKEMPDIKKLSGDTGEEIALDVTKPINYQILAYKSGIMGINYDKIDFVKAEGDFRRVNKVSRSDLDNIEGMVNFNPKKGIMTIAGGENKVDVGAVSLLKKSDIKRKYGGKVKMYIPFNIIDGVHLSTMDCKVTSELYIKDPAHSGNLKKYEGDYSDIIETDVAEGVTPEQGKWRVDDKTNSLIFNVTLPNAAKLPGGSKAAKLDVTISHFSSVDTLPRWIKDWDGKKTPNLINMFSKIYTYQEKSNSAENSFTLYLETK